MTSRDATANDMTPPTGEGLTIAAMRGQQGKRTVYMTKINIPQFVEQVPVLTDTPKRELKEQRIYDPKHAGAIADYTLAVEDYVLPPLMITLDSTPIWSPIAPDSDFGWLTIKPGTKRRITDGMHRGDGLSQAVANDTEGKLEADDIGAWIVVEPDIVKRRGMFTDVNHNQKSMPKSLTYTFDPRDPYAVGLRQVVATHPLLRNVVEEEKSRASKGSGKLFTMAALYSAAQNFAGTSLTDAKVVEQQARKVFDIIQNARPELMLARTPDEIDLLRSTSLIASSTTLRVIAGALHRGISRGRTVDQLQAALAQVSFDPADALWRECGFTSPGSNSPSSRNQEIRNATDALADRIAPTAAAA